MSQQATVNPAIQELAARIMESLRTMNDSTTAIEFLCRTFKMIAESEKLDSENFFELIRQLAIIVASQVQTETKKNKKQFWGQIVMAIKLAAVTVELTCIFFEKESGFAVSGF